MIFVGNVEVNHNLHGCIESIRFGLYKCPEVCAKMSYFRANFTNKIFGNMMSFNTSR